MYTISQNALLGMSVFVDQFLQKMEDKNLHHMDKQGEVLSTKVHISCYTVIPVNTEYQISCRLLRSPSREYGHLKKHSDKYIGIRIETALVSFRGQRVQLCCINPYSTPVELKAGTNVGNFSTINHKQILDKKAYNDNYSLSHVTTTSTNTTQNRTYSLGSLTSSHNI